jgi:methoxymalonate biosynthesis acyl carrier protein
MEEAMTAVDTSLATDAIKAKTKAFINKFFPQHDLQDDEDIFALGFVNSLFALQLVMFVEKEFNMAVSDDDLHIDNFRSIGAIAALIERKDA